MTVAKTFGEFKRAGGAPAAGVRDEMRRNLLRKMAAREPLFPGLLGYQDTVVPRVVNAVASG